MIIVSQDKRHSWNYENLEDVYVPDEVIETKNWCVKVTTLRGDSYVIGYYKTEERAKEVLKEIILAHSNFETIRSADENRKELAITICSNNYEYFDTYEMPGE